MVTGKNELSASPSEASDTRPPSTDPAYIPTSYQVAIDMVTGETQVRGYRDGRVVESYRSYERGEASVAVIALLNGFQPPRGLSSLDRPTG